MYIFVGENQYAKYNKCQSLANQKYHFHRRKQVGIHLNLHSTLHEPLRFLVHNRVSYSKALSG